MFLLNFLLLATPVFQYNAANIAAELKPLATLPFEARVMKVAQATLGTPYQDGPLGEGPSGEYDKDPLIDLSRVDCVTFIEQSLALSCGGTWDEVVSRLQNIRYENGQVDYRHRNHFMITDWIAHNTFCRDISGTLGIPTRDLTRTISHKDFFVRVKAPNVGQDIPDRNQTISYIPIDQAQAAEAKLPNLAIVIFIGKVDWLFALHCGFFIRQPGEEGKLYQASLKQGKVIACDLSDYCNEQNKRYLGFTAYAVDDLCK